MGNLLKNKLSLQFLSVWNKSSNSNNILYGDYYYYNNSIRIIFVTI